MNGLISHGIHWALDKNSLTGSSLGVIGHKFWDPCYRLNLPTMRDLCSPTKHIDSRGYMLRDRCWHCGTQKRENAMERILQSHQRASVTWHIDRGPVVHEKIFVPNSICNLGLSRTSMHFWPIFWLIIFMVYTCIGCHATFDKSHSLEAHKRTCHSHKTKSGKLKNLVWTLSLSSHVTTSGPSTSTTPGMQILELPEIPESLETKNPGEINLDELELVSIHRGFFYTSN